MGIREGMPLLAKHEGHWTGTYTHVNPAGEVVDRHRSYLSCLFPPSGDHAYHQVNVYTWPDGRTETHRFPGRYDGYGRMHFDTERIRGVTWALDENTLYLTWIFKERGSDLRLFELIVLSDDGARRCRTWQWVRNGALEMRTLINETRITGDEPAASPFGERDVKAVTRHLNGEHADDNLLIVRALGGRPEATGARAVDVDELAIAFDADVAGRQERVRVPWSAPVTVRPQIRGEVTRMYYDACAVLGVEPRAAQEH